MIIMIITTTIIIIIVIIIIIITTTVVIIMAEYAYVAARILAWLGPVRFGSVPRLVPTGCKIKRFDSFRFVSVRFGVRLSAVVPFFF